MHKDDTRFSGISAARVGCFINTYLRCTGGARRERIARRYAIPVAASARLIDHQRIIMYRQGPTNHENNGVNLNRSGVYRSPGRFGGEAAVGFSSTLALMVADVVVDCRATSAFQISTPRH